MLDNLAGGLVFQKYILFHCNLIECIRYQNADVALTLARILVSPEYEM